MKKLLTLCVIVSLFSCKSDKIQNKKEIGDFSVSLTKKIDLGSQVKFSFRILDSFPEEVKGLPKLDTMRLQYFKFKSGITPDSISPDKIYAYSGYENGKYVIAYDRNFNKDLSDDKRHYFDRQFGKWRMGANYDQQIAYDTIEYSEYKLGKTIKNTHVFKVVPNDSMVVKPGNFMFTELIIRMPAYLHKWYGTMSLSDEEYNVAVSPSWNGTSYTFAKKEEDFPSRMDYDFVETKLKDTVQIETSYFRIDSITPDFSEVFFTDLKLKEKAHGIAVGDELKDLKFNDIQFTTTSFSKLMVDKEYLLIDFWGTWCAPCIKLNPEVKKLNEEFSKHLSIVSLAFDDDRNKVFEHITTHEMKWNHVFLQRDLKAGMEKYPKILDDLRIDTFPTFILLDKELNILVRGTGAMALEEVQEILSQYE